MSDGNICDVVLTFYKSVNRSNDYEFIFKEYKSFNGLNVYHKSLKGIQTILINKVKTILLRLLAVILDQKWKTHKNI